jgi:hypothetical protein
MAKTPRTNTLKNEHPAKTAITRCGYQHEITDITILVSKTARESMLQTKTIAGTVLLLRPVRWRRRREPTRSKTSTSGQRRPPNRCGHQHELIDIQIEAYGKRSYGDDPKLTTNSTHQPQPKTINR